MKPVLPPKVSLSGEAIRSIREGKNLTQLYVAKVVGVTTDTISRWENNRYPSVKRENALRLAEALEVEVEALLEREEKEGVQPAAELPAAVRRPLLRFLPFLVFAGLALAGLLYLLWPDREILQPSVNARRLLPVYAPPSGVVPVRVRLEIETELKGFILREHFPPGWKLIESSPPASSLDNEEGTARWIVKPEDPRRLITYLVKVADSAAVGEKASFGGELVANPNGRSDPVPVAGDSLVEVAPFLWADQNGDRIIDDGEMLMASDTVEEMKGVHLDWTLLERIWDAGSYRWDQEKKQFLPMRHQPPPAADGGEDK